MTRPARVDRQTRAAALANALGARNGAVLAAVAAPEGDGETTAELWLYGVVGGYWWGFNDKTVADQLRGLVVDHITVRLNSPGGDSIQGIAIGNLLRNHKATVTVVVDGLAASAASIIAVAGDDVVMSPGSQMMVHDPWFFTVGNAKELRWDADFLDKQGANMAGVYAHEAGGTPESWRAAMTAEPDGTWYSADEAVAAKLADRVGTVVAVSAAPEPPAMEMDDGDEEMAARAAWDLEVLIAPAARAAWQYGDRAAAAAGSAGPQPPSPPGPGSATPTTQEGEPAVSFTDEQLTNMRQQLGLAADADEATIAAALTEALAEQAEDPADLVVPAALPTPTTAALPPGVVAIDAEVLAQLQAGATAGAAASARQAQEDRDSVIAAALRAGKITANTRGNYEELWAKDADGTRKLLDALPSGLVPVDEIGHDQTTLERQNALGSETAIKGLAATFGLSEEVYA